MEILRRIAYLLNRRAHDRELADEIEAHREMSGIRDFGNVLRLREESRDAWGWTWIDRLFQDIRYALRTLRKSPSFTLTAVLMLALGIGANVAAFGVFNITYLQPLAIPEPESLLRFTRRSPERYANSMPHAEVDFFRRHASTLSSVMALHLSRVDIDDKPATAHFVSTNLFAELGAYPIAGRLLHSSDEAPDAAPVAVLSYNFWKRQFAGDPAVVGQKVKGNGKPLTIVGVAQESFSGLTPHSRDLWLPISQQPYYFPSSKLLAGFESRDGEVQMWGRLRRGLTAKAAEQELRSLAAELRKQHPEGVWKDESIPSKPGGTAQGMMIGSRSGTGTEPRDEKGPVLMLIGCLTLLILIVACGNLGSLLMARGVSREREIAIRLSVGASRARVVRQLFTESVVLALLGAAAGLAAGYAILRSLMQTTGAPGWMDARPDWRVALFAATVAVAAALLFGLAPALQTARRRLRASRTRHVLIGAQVAGSCVLVIVAALLVRALDRAMSAHPGFEYKQVVSIKPGLDNHGYSPEKAKAYFSTLRERLITTSGVDSVSLSVTPPLGGSRITTQMNDNGKSYDIHMHRIDTSFFRTMQIPLLRGRNLADGDVDTIVVSESLARQRWPGEDPIGKTLELNSAKQMVVGIAGSARSLALQDSDAVEMYSLALPGDYPSMTMLVRTSGPPEGLLSFLASSARKLDSNLFPDIQLLKASFERKMKSTGQSALAVSALGTIALLLACLGIVGLVSYAVSQRTREIGIRMALGAPRSHVLGVAVRQLAIPVIVGLILGVGGAAAISQLLRRELYGVSHLDPVAYLLAISLFVTLAGFAALLPARRALRVDPMTALRCD